MMGLDGYSLRARWLPCVLIATPVVLGCASWLPSLQWSLPTTVPLLAAIAVPLSQLARNKGRDVQTRLWREWGGPPTTSVLRNGSERISRESLHRYRGFIGQLVPDIRLPAAAEEGAASAGRFDGVYSAATTALINRTQDKREFSRLYNESVWYGFWRNLLGLRLVGIGFATLGTAVAVARILTSVELPVAAVSSATVPLPANSVVLAGIAVVVSLVFLLFFQFKLTGEVVKRAGFNYAECLVEASEQLMTKERQK